jgi:spore maturation protein SpmB
MRPQSGSGASGLIVDAMTTYGEGRFQGTLACIIQGSTEITLSRQVDPALTGT